MSAAKTVPHSRSGDDKECALVAHNLNYNTFSSGDTFINCDNWLDDCQNDAPRPEEQAATTTETASTPYSCPGHANSFSGTVLHVYVISAGFSLFLMPRYFFAVGYFAATALTFIVFFLYWHCLKMILWSEAHICKIKRRPCMTYAETILHCVNVGPASVRWLAPYSYFFVRILFVVTWCGALELQVISSNLRTVCRSVFDLSLDVEASMLIIFVPMLLLTWVHRLKYLVPLSMIADGITLFCVLMVLLHVIVDPQPLSFDPDVGSLEYVPVFLGSTLFAVNTTALMLPLKNEMKEPRRFNAKWGVLNVTLPVISFIYAIFGLLCSMKYGSRLLERDTVIECLDANKRTLDIIVALYTLSVALQYPLVTYVVFDTIWSGFLRNERNTMKHQTCCEYAVRTAVYLISYLVTYNLPHLNVILSICGTIGFVFDSLLFPALINSLLMWKLYGNVRKVKLASVKNGFIALIAILVAYITLYVSVSQLATDVSDEIRGNCTD